MRTLTLADGSSFVCDWCGMMDNVLAFNLTEENDLTKIATVFSDHDKTREIMFTAGKNVDRYAGFTSLRSITAGGWETGGTLVTMLKAEV